MSVIVITKLCQFWYKQLIIYTLDMVSPNYILLSKFEEYIKNISWKEKRSRNQKI
jgi:hypothetical protein